MKINILDEAVVSKIAAGEVVERPASVVKELVENSIDAGADSIEIEVQDGGKTLIRVADNGEGMVPEDAKKACLQHSTSKLKDVDDLERITTLGFRGEALSSITAVSQADIITRSGEEKQGVYLYLESGEILKSRPAGRSQGTTIEIRNLFYNVPARKKFLKKESTEFSEIISVIGRFIVARPDIEFKLMKSDRCILHANRQMDVMERVGLVIGNDVTDQLMPVTGNTEKYEISGFVSRPSFTRKDRKGQMFFLNGRFIKSRVLSDAVQEAYRSMVERGRFPSAVLFLTVPPDAVDVNVHPTKMQVKFEDEKDIKNVITGTVNDAFSDLAEAAEGKDKGNLIASFENTEHKLEKEVNIPEKETFQQQEEFSYDYDRVVSHKAFDARKPAVYFGENTVYAEKQDIFQIGGCYIVQIEKDGLRITDQHAAHERIMYEFFSSAAETGNVEVQNLLFPVRLDFSAREADIMEKIIPDFKKLGFKVESFGDRSFIVQAVPAVIKERDVQTVIYDVLTDIMSNKAVKIELIDELVKRTSCRAAIKAGDILTREEMCSLLEKFRQCNLPFTCPHGRPVVIDITTDELEKRFRRK